MKDCIKNKKEHPMEESPKPSFLVIHKGKDSYQREYVAPQE